MGYAPHSIIILLCLMPDYHTLSNPGDFTCQGESVAAQWVMHPTLL